MVGFSVPGQKVRFGGVEGHVQSGGRKNRQCCIATALCLHPLGGAAPALTLTCRPKRGLGAQGREAESPSEPERSQALTAGGVQSVSLGKGPQNLLSEH